MERYLPKDSKLGVQLPARLDAAQTAEILGVEPHDIPILVANGLLKPLGKPAQNARKYFARVEILMLADDAIFLNRATGVLYRHWQERNAKRSAGDLCAAENG
jgi:hypothetical protein